MMSSSSGSCGSDRNRSVSHISAASTLPREMPAIAPMIVPTTTATAIAASPTASDMRPPYSSRANRSWPRSSVPKGCCHDGPISRAVKSISLIGTCHSSGPSTTARIIDARIATLATARRWRRKRRQASMPGDTCFLRTIAPTSKLSVGNARVEPAIENIRNQIERDDQTGKHERHRHDHGGIVGQDRADEQRSDARDAEDLFGDDGTSEHSRHLQGDQRHHRDQRVAYDVLHHHHELGEPFGAGGGDIVEPDHVEDRGAHEARPRSALEQAKDGHRHQRLLEKLPVPPPPGGADVGAIHERQPVEINAEHQDEQNAGEEG